MMTIVFMGTPEFSVPTLQSLIDQGYDVRAVVAQPDRPKGRGQHKVISPVKVCAERYRLPVLQPEKIRTPDSLQAIQHFAPDLVVVVAYGQILPKAMLQIPRLGCLNVHASLLPKYRGAAPIQWAIIQGEQETGVTTMCMDEGMDTGAMLLRKTIPIEADDTAATLYDKLARLGAELLIETVQRMEQGALTPTPQDQAAATYAPPLKKEDGRINWQDSAWRIYNTVRGCAPWPGAYTCFQGKMVKLLQVRIESTPLIPLQGGVGGGFQPLPGTVVALDKHIGPVIATGAGYIRIIEIQPENKKPMRCSDYCRGYHLTVGERLG